MQEQFKDVDKIQEVLREAQTGLWTIELDEGSEPRMYADRSMLELLGIKGEVAPEECYRIWYGRIDPSFYATIQSGVERMTLNDRAEVQYPWTHPEWGRIYVRCGGVRDYNYKKGICLRGYHQNITNTVMLKQEYDTVIQALTGDYRAIFLCNLEDGSYKIIKAAGKYEEQAAAFSDFRKLFRHYVETEVTPQHRYLVAKLSDLDQIRTRIEEDSRQTEVYYRNVKGGWRRLKIVPAAGYSPEYPWVIAAVDQQDGEMERRMDDAAAKTAVSQIYKMVLSVDCRKEEYNCIYYSGDGLKPERHGKYRELYNKIKDKMPSEDREELKQIFNPDSYNKHEIREGILRIENGGGQLLYYNYYAALISQDMEERVLLTIRDIDNMQELQKREKILANLCQCYYSIYIFDLEKGMEEAIWQEENIRNNREFPIGSLQEYYEKFVSNYVHEDDKEKMRRAGSPEFLKKTLSPEQPVYDVDFRRLYPGRTEWVRSRFSIAEMRDGQVTKVIFANMNINEQKREELLSEEQNRRALLAAYEETKRANEAKSSFLAQMSHDIRTPMNAIVGMTAIAEAHADDRDRVEDCLKKIDISGRHLLELINEILDMSRIEKGKIELTEAPFSLGSLIADVESIVKPEVQKKNHSLSIESTGIVHDRLFGDAGRIRQVLINLINNAVKYTQPGGRIKVTIQEMTKRVSGYGSYVFTVEDNGIGISGDFLDYIFVPFSRADEAKVRNIQGTGLGMSIAQGIVAAMNGNIQAESQEGCGSRFTVTLNLKLGDEAEADIPDSGQEGQCFQALMGVRILLAEDNELNMEIAGTLLREQGIIVDEAENGQEAVQAFLNSPAGTYQAILMDLQMPVMDGYTAAREIRNSSHSQAADIPVIALTANAFAEDVARVMAAGMNDHVSKPVDMEHLGEVLCRHVRKDERMGSPE